MNYDRIRAEIRHTATEDALLAVRTAGGEARLSTIESAVDGLTRADSTAIAQRLRDHGLVSLETSLVGEVTLTYDGRTLADRILRSRADGPDRWDAVQRGLLRWVSDGEPKDVGNFGSDPAAVAFGSRFTVEEIEQAAEYLVQNELMQAIPTAQGHLLRPKITPQGRYALHHDGAIAEYLMRGGGSTTYDYSSSNTMGDNNVVGAQLAGHSNIANVVQTLTPAQRSEVLDGVGELLRGIDSSESPDPELRSSVEAIANEASSDGASKASIKERITLAIVTAGASEIGHLAFRELSQLLAIVAS